MLIEFSVANFRSFRGKQTLSMAAAPRLGKKGNVFSPEVFGEKLPDLLKVAAIYGPNASGKSNLIKALGVVSKIARITPDAFSKPLPVTPFKFDEKLLDKPSSFEINFIQNGRRYAFYLDATADRIVEEKLYEFPRGKEALLYSRTHASDGDEYVIGESLEGGQILHDAWKNLTGQKTLFLAQAVANSSEKLNQLRIPFQWLRNSITTMTGMAQWANASHKLMMNHPDFISDVSSFLRRVDVPITNIEFEQIEDLANEKQGLDDNDLASQARDRGNAGGKTTLTHRTQLGEAKFDLSDESRGTRNLIGFWLPWRVFGQSVEKAGHQILSVDELDSSLHPEIVAALIEQHLSNSLNRQLIFTTHDTHLMNSKLLRRDQFWIVERDMDGATRLRSIHDFQGREGEQIEKRYYEGRYRGLPIIRKG